MLHLNHVRMRLVGHSTDFIELIRYRSMDARHSISKTFQLAMNCITLVVQGKISGKTQYNLRHLQKGYDNPTLADTLLYDISGPDDIALDIIRPEVPLSTDKREAIIECLWSDIQQGENRSTLHEMLQRARDAHFHLTSTLLEHRGHPERSKANRLLELLGKTATRPACGYDLAAIREGTYWHDCILDILHEQLIVPLATATSNTQLNDDRSLHSLRKKTGSFYTPPRVARYISGQTLTRWLEHRAGPPTADGGFHALIPKRRTRILEFLKSVRILDPAVGAGIFLIQAGEWLLKLRRAFGDNLTLSEMKREIVAKNLYGVDILPDSVVASRRRLALWCSSGETSLQEGQVQSIVNRIRKGNSLLGMTLHSKNAPSCLGDTDIFFHWPQNLPHVFRSGGFDIVIGNPPYGNILSDYEKRVIDATARWSVSGGRSGTWNAAPLFLVRGRELLNGNGHMGMLLPNSILRVGQFQKTREFMLKELDILEIQDEASPIDDITLELFSLIAAVPKSRRSRDVLIRSNRKGIRERNVVRRSSLEQSKIFVLYHDDILELARKRGKAGLLSASRGRDIPSSHVRKKSGGSFSVPYATSGRSVRRYRIDWDYLRYVDDWFKEDAALMESYENSFLIATKNLPFPRTLLKPRGLIHGGGIVKIDIHDSGVAPSTVGMILNSTMARYLCIRYLTNYSELTTCLNTGIMDELPIVLPECQEVYGWIFNELQRRHCHARTHDNLTMQLDALADALVYEAYLLDDSCLDQTAHEVLKRNCLHHNGLRTTKEIVEGTSKLVSEIMSSEEVKRVENSPRMN